MKFNNKKCLVAYFSRKGENYVSGDMKNLSVGNTAKAATMIQEEIGCEIFEIESTKGYSDNYRKCVEEARDELKTKARPELKNHLENMDEYEVVFIGYPNWCGTCPMPVFTFLEEYDFTRKTVIPFCTHEGSGLSGSEKDIAKVSKAAKIEKGIAIHGSHISEAKSSVVNWLKSL